MIALLLLFGIGHGHASVTAVLVPLVLIAAGACVGAATLPLLRTALGRARGAIRGWRARRTGGASAAGAELRARALMGELCPHGWQARITIYAGATGGRSLVGEGPRAPVALDWAELRPGGEEPAVMRRVWADSVPEALDAMVADRRTDMTLEQIELRATADGARWPDA